MNSKQNIRIGKIVLNEGFVCLFILLLAICILTIPAVIKYMHTGSIIVGDESYYHARIARELAHSFFITADSLNYAERPYIFNPFDYVLAALSFFLTLEIAITILPILLGVGSLILFFSLLKQMNMPLFQRAITCLLLIASPLFIKTYAESTAYCLIIFLLLLGIHFFLKKSESSFLASIIIFSILSFFSVFVILILSMLFFALARQNKEKTQKSIVAAFTIFFIAIAYYIPFYLTIGFSHNPSFLHLNYIQSLISDLGGTSSFGIFHLILAIVGLLAVWKGRDSQKTPFLLLSFLLASSFFDAAANIYNNFLIAFFAGFGFLLLIQMKWNVKIIKDLTILIIVCGLLFSFISFIPRISQNKPSKLNIVACDWLKNNTQKDSVILSHYENGLFIEYYAERPVFMDAYFPYAPNINERYASAQQIFNSRNLEKTRNLLKQYNISYIYIDADMKHGLVWNKEEQGLLFVLRDEDTFIRMYHDEEGTEIWKFLGT